MNARIPETSIVIRALNEERWLPDVFAALRGQNYRNFEVILVDSGSVDRTRDIAAAEGAKIIRLRPEDFTFGHSLNVGIAEARGDLIAIISAHAIPADEFWLERLVERLREPGVAMVYGGQRGHECSKFSEVCDFERMFPTVPRELDPEKPFANNANSGVKRELWKAHPFDEGLPGLEDIEWAKHWAKEGLMTWYEPNACVIHVHMETWPQVRRRYYREGMAARWVGLRILRHIPAEIWRETRWLIQDLFRAASRFRLLKHAGEIVRFRIEKTIGTVRGIIDSKGLSNPARRVELFVRKEFQALVVRGPGRVRLEERTVPNLRPGEVLVRVAHVGICGTDLEIIDGRLAYFQNGMASYPIVPGHESSGTVVALGPRVTDLREGDRVVVECIQGCGECNKCRRDEAIRCRERSEVGVMGQDGACASYFVTRARYAHVIPSEVTLAQAALIEPLAVVLKGLRRLGSVREGDRPRRCAVVGAGTIGHLAAQVLKARGHAVTVFDPVEDRLQALNGSVATFQSLQNLDQFEWLVEATGQQAILSTLLDQAATGAVLLLLGLPYSTQNFNFESIVAYDRSVVGSVGSTGLDFEHALATIPTIDTTPFLRACFPLAQYEDAFAAARSKSVLKCMLTLESPV